VELVAEQEGSTRGSGCTRPAEHLGQIGRGEGGQQKVARARVQRRERRCPRLLAEQPARRIRICIRIRRRRRRRHRRLGRRVGERLAVGPAKVKGETLRGSPSRSKEPWQGVATRDNVTRKAQCRPAVIEKLQGISAEGNKEFLLEGYDH
jgi:hypothetical protein